MNNYSLQNKTFYYEELSQDISEEVDFLKKYYFKKIEKLKNLKPPSSFNILSGVGSVNSPLPIKKILDKDIVSICTIITSPNTVTGIHSDICPYDDEYNFRILALNFIMEGGEGAKTYFYESSDAFPTPYLNNGINPAEENNIIYKEFLNSGKTKKGYPFYGGKLYFNSEPIYTEPKLYTCKKVAECEILKPTIINVDSYHRVINLKDSYRVSISIRFTEDPWSWTSSKGIGFHHNSKVNKILLNRKEKILSK